MARKPILIPCYRKSSGEDPAVSLARQRRVVQAWAEANGVQLAPEVWEPGVSGSKPWQERGLGEAIAACKRGEADGIVVEDQSRLSRENGKQTAEVWDALQNGSDPLRLVCVADGLDTANGDQELSFAIRAALAREQWKQYARRADDSKRQAIDRGVHICQRVPIGYVRPGRGQRLQLDPDTWTIIRDAFVMRATGAGYHEIATMLNDRLPGGATGKGRWKQSSVRYMMKNRVYVGEARQGKYVNPNGHDALIDAQTFATVQAFARQSERADSPRTLALLAGVVYCAGCGYAMTRSTQNGKYQAYRCKRDHATERCDAPAFVSVPDLDAHIERVVLDRLEAQQTAFQLVPARVNVAEIHARRDAAQAQLATYLDPAFVADLGGLEVVRPTVAKIRSELDAIDVELVEAVGSDHDRQSRRVVDVLAAWDTAGIADKRATIRDEVDVIFCSRVPRRTPLLDRIDVRFVGDDAPFVRPTRGHQSNVEAGILTA